MYKLNLDFTELNKPIDQKKTEHVNRWATPIGWWTVTTEGDEEGRTSTQLGQYYGHVAEIAFHLADRCFYSINFHALKGTNIVPSEPVKYVATGHHVNVSFWDSDCPFFLNGIKSKEATLQKWLDAEGVKVKPCNFYGAATLTI